MILNYGDFAGPIMESMDPNDIDKFKNPRPKVYHRTKDASVDLIGRDGYRAGGGAAWGAGIYTVYDLISTTKANAYNDGSWGSGTYGPIIIENEVLSLKRFLIFNYDVSKRVNKGEYTIKDQLKKILPEKVYERHSDIISKASDRSEELLKANPKNKYTTESFSLLYEIGEIMHFVRGAIFTGSHDGNVLLSFDRENLIPVRYSKDNGKTWTKIKKQGAYLKAKKNLKRLLHDGNSGDILVLVEDHIDNLVTASGCSSLEEYINRYAQRIDLEGLLMPFSYLIELKESEYPDLEKMKDLIKEKIYGPALRMIIEKMEKAVGGSKSTVEKSLEILSWKGLDSIRKFSKLIPGEYSKVVAIVEKGLKDIKEYLDRKIEEKDYSRYLILSSLMDRELSNFDNSYKEEEIADEVSSIQRSMEKNIKVVQPYIESQNRLFRSLKSLKSLGSDTRTIKLTSSSPGDGEFSVDELKKISSEIVEYFEQNPDAKLKYERWRGLTAQSYSPGNGSILDSVDVSMPIMMLQSEAIDKLIGAGYVADDSKNFSDVLSFFSGFEKMVANAAGKEAKEYLEERFEDNLRYLEGSKEKAQEIGGPVSFRIMKMTDAPKDRIKKEALYFLSAKNSDSSGTGTENFDSESFEKAVGIVKGVGVRFDFSDFDSFSTFYPDANRIMAEEGLIDRRIFLLYGIVARYEGKDRSARMLSSERALLEKDHLSDEEAREAEDLMKSGDKDFIKAFVGGQNRHKLISKSPVSLSYLIDNNFIDESDLQYICMDKIVHMIKSKDFERLESLVKMMASKGIKMMYISSGCDEDEIKAIPDSIVAYMLESGVASPNSAGQFMRKSDEIAAALMKKGIFALGLIESEEMKDRMAEELLKLPKLDKNQKEALKHLIVRIDFLKNVDKLRNIFMGTEIGSLIWLICFIASSDRKALSAKFAKDLPGILDTLEKGFGDGIDLNFLDESSKDFKEVSKSNPGFTFKNLCSGLLEIADMLPEGSKAAKNLRDAVKSKGVSADKPAAAVSERRIMRFSSFGK